LSERLLHHKDAGINVDSVEWTEDALHELASDTIILVSDPPSGFHRIVSLYMKKVGVKYQFVAVVETDPVP